MSVVEHTWRWTGFCNVTVVARSMSFCGWDYTERWTVLGKQLYNCRAGLCTQSWAEEGSPGLGNEILWLGILGG